MRSTELTDRTLWFDGTSSFNPAHLLRTMGKYDIKFVDSINESVTEYNRHASAAKELKVKESCNPLIRDWTMPQEYKELNIVQYLADKHYEMIKSKPENECLEREKRLAQELKKYDEIKLFDVLRAIIWIINTLSANNIVWGVGRGSSVSSYVLYVIGVHDVDSYAYNLEIDDFLHE